MVKINQFFVSIIKSFGFIVGKFLNILDIVFRKRFSLYFLESLKNSVNNTIVNDDIIFDATELSNYYRGRELLTKEPDTLYWIDTYMKKDDVFFDIGANIGTYSLYAAKKKSMKVFALEPESSNFYFLNKNIYLNHLENNITAINVALNNSDKLSYLNLVKFIVGGTEINFDEALNHVREKFSPVFKQGVLGFSLDSLVEKFSIPLPNHIKIDVGGDEKKIFEGLENILKSSELKTIMIELNHNLEEHLVLIEKFKTLGFKQLSEDSLRNLEYEKTKIYNHFFIKE